VPLIYISESVVDQFCLRRPYNDDYHYPEGYQESNRDFMTNNEEICIGFLEVLEELNKAGPLEPWQG